MINNSKNVRHATIRRIVENEEISTQDELCTRLLEEGFDVTQATASRDIKELRLSKMTNSAGKLIYHIPPLLNNNVSKSKYVRVLSETLLSMSEAENILVMKTVSGMAMAAAAALDSLNVDGLVGCIAGDDTIFCAIKTKEMVKDVRNMIEDMLKGLNA